ncbi:MAG: hypothetical protein EOO61_09420 [Hymenobacter sp.]|nr:MAG: hypothetical protein EOO61_09420 [Hymenobacter sp.]
MTKLPETLRENVRLLGELLGETLLKHEGEAVFSKVEEIRKLGKAINKASEGDSQQLVDLLDKVGDAEILPIVRAFNQFLNLANLAEQEYASSIEAASVDTLDHLLIEQKQRLEERLKDPAKMWKYNKQDFEEAKFWDKYQEMYEDCFEYCNNPAWTIVPADQNWYKEYVIAKALRDLLKGLNMQYPGIKKE